MNDNTLYLIENIEKHLVNIGGLLGLLIFIVSIGVGLYVFNYLRDSNYEDSI